MSDRSSVLCLEAIGCVGNGFVGIGVDHGDLSYVVLDLVGSNLVFSVFVVCVVYVVGVRLFHLLPTSRRPADASAGFRTVPPLGPRSLCWVRRLLPRDEGTAWWAEVVSCLAATTDPDERRRYVRSYRETAPQLIWVSWSEHLRASRRRKLS